MSLRKPRRIGLSFYKGLYIACQTCVVEHKGNAVLLITEVLSAAHYYYFMCDSRLWLMFVFMKLYNILLCLMLID